MTMKSIVFADAIPMDDFFGPKVARLGLEEHHPSGGPQKDERYLKQYGGGIICHPTDDGDVRHVELFILKSHGNREEAAASAHKTLNIIRKYFNTTTYVDYTPKRPSEDKPRLEQYHRELHSSLIEHARFNQHQNKRILGLWISDHLDLLLTHNLVAANPAFVEEDHWQEFIEAFRRQEAKIREFFRRDLAANPGTNADIKSAILNSHPEWEAELESGAMAEYLQREEPFVKEWLSTLVDYGFEPIIRHLPTGMFPEDSDAKFNLLRDYFATEVQTEQEADYYDYREAIRVRMID
jgi:hypothetical protein